jgi:predicted kinase
MILFVLSGLPGSGKTTRAKELAGATSAILLCRDELRSSYCNLSNEVLLTKLMGAQAQYLLNTGQNVIIDSWNLAKSDEDLWKAIASSSGACLYWEHLQVDVELCVLRDSTRPQSIGAECVRNAANENAARLEQLSRSTGMNRSIPVG